MKRLLLCATFAVALASFILHPSSLPAQPALVVSAGSGAAGGSLTLNSDSSSPWKGFVLTSGSAGTYNVLWAESNGTTGGIYYGTITATSTAAASFAVSPPPPAPADLPLNTLTTAVMAATSGVDPPALATLAASYEALAKQMDAGTIVSPLQLQIVTGTQLLTAFNAQQIDGLKPFETAVAGWLDARQCEGKLTPQRIDRYAVAYHAIAAALGGANPKQAASTKSEKCCPDGKCPPAAAAPFDAMPTMGRWHRGRN